MSLRRPQKQMMVGKIAHIATRIAVGLMTVALTLTGAGVTIAPAHAATELHTIQLVTPEDWSGNLAGYTFTITDDLRYPMRLTVSSDGTVKFPVPEYARYFVVNFDQSPTLEHNFPMGYVALGGGLTQYSYDAQEFYFSAESTTIELAPAGVITGQLNLPTGVTVDLTEWIILVFNANGGTIRSAHVRPDGSFTVLGVPVSEPVHLMVGNPNNISTEVAQGYVTASGSVTSSPYVAADFYAGHSDLQVNLPIDIKIQGEIVLPVDPATYAGDIYPYAEDPLTGEQLSGEASLETFEIGGLEAGKEYLIYFQSINYFGAGVGAGYLNAAGQVVMDRSAAVAITAGAQDVVAHFESTGTLGVQVNFPVGVDRGNSLLDIAYIDSETGESESRTLWSNQSVLEFTGLIPGREYMVHFDNRHQSLNIPSGYIGPDGALVRTPDEAQLFTSADYNAFLNLHVGTSIKGKIHVPSSGVVEPQYVMAVDRGTGDQRIVRPDAAGNFEVSGLWPENDYFLKARQRTNWVYSEGYLSNDGYLTTDSTKYQTVTAPRSDIDIHLTAPSSITGQISLPAGVSPDAYQEMELQVQAQNGAWNGLGEVEADGSFTLEGVITGEPNRIYLNPGFGNKSNLVSGYLTATGSITPQETKAHWFTAPLSGVDIVTEVGTSVAVQLKPRRTDSGVLHHTYLGLFNTDGELVTTFDVAGNHHVLVDGIPAGQDYYLGLHSEGHEATNPTYTYLGAGGFLVDDLAHAVLLSTPASNIVINIPPSTGVLPGVLTGVLEAPEEWTGTNADLEVCAFDSANGKPESCAPLSSSGTFNFSKLQAGVGYTLYFRDAAGRLHDGVITSSGAVGSQAAVFHASVSPQILLQPELKSVPADPDPPVPVLPEHKFAQIVPTPDVSGDGIGDVLAVDHDGVLWLYRGKGDGGLSVVSRVGAGWGNLVISAPGDFNSDGKADILAKAPNGDLFFYPGNGKGGFGNAVKVGWAWGPYQIIPAGDVTGDGVPDVLAIDEGGVLYYYAGNGKGGFTGKLTRNGQGWTNIDLYPAGDLNGDGNADILSIRADGSLHTHLGRGDGGFSKSTQTGKGWAGYELFAGSDANQDGLADLYSRDAENRLWFYAGKPGGFRTALHVGSGW